jgi:hypothetical protein
MSYESLPGQDPDQADLINPLYLPFAAPGNEEILQELNDICEANADYTACTYDELMFDAHVLAFMRKAYQAGWISGDYEFYGNASYEYFSSEDAN